ncbi:MAG TPA: zinc-binding alcohol dehydrogenase [Solirubrobacteraceae bacterium]|nr:zinc-binding alcohol dehydrogenase [Solirubrobacteraceae bacterium]
MASVVQFTGPREVALADGPDPPLGPREVRVETLYSGISAGTELTAYRGSNPYMAKRWEGGRRLFVDGTGPTLSYPVEGWGYEECGRVVEVGPDVRAAAVGDLVYGTWGHRSRAVLPEDRARGRMPDGLEPIAGVFSRIGAIALNGVLDADIHVGEHVAVFGQGVPGLIATQLARLNGASVIAVDAIPARLELARRLGAEHVVDVTREDAGEAVKAITAGRGADVSIEISGSHAALHQAIRATAYNSRVVACGFFQGEARGLYLGEEFHHNRIGIVCSQISGVRPDLAHRWDLARLERTVMGLAAARRVDLGALVSHVLPYERAAEAFRLLDEEPASAVQVVLDFTGESAA